MMSKTVTHKSNASRISAGTTSPHGNNVGQATKVTVAGTPATTPIKNDFANLKEAAMVIQRIRLNAQKEIEEVRKMRADALKYQRETATKARSEAQQLVLRTRLATQREVEEMIRQASEEIQKVLADIRIIRITAQEELAAQRKFTDAAKLSTMSLALKKETDKGNGKRKKQLAAAK
jgi:hypothetical protein